MNQYLDLSLTELLKLWAEFKYEIEQIEKAIKVKAAEKKMEEN